jgi:long-chain acyl-CoA synthetase
MVEGGSPWLDAYPPGVPAQIDPDFYPSLTALLEEAMLRHGGRTAFSCLGARLDFNDLDAQSAALAAWLQDQGVAPGDRVALMLPNVLHLPVAQMAAWRAGATVVNVNPQYTAQELAFQLRDSGATTLFVLENFAHTAAAARQGTALQRIVLCSVGEMFHAPRRWLVDAVLRHVRHAVPPHGLAGTGIFRWRSVLAGARGRRHQAVATSGRDIAVLQYTGGTTGVAKGAMLLHRNLVANILQVRAWYEPALQRVPDGEQAVFVTALPLYHIYALTCCALLTIHAGAHALLIPNPRDLKAFVAALRKTPFHVLPALNTLFNALLNYPPFLRLDFSHLVLTGAGGMAVQGPVAERWQAATGSPICEGYGLSETSPVATINPVNLSAYSGSIGLPMPSTEVAILDDAGQHLPAGETGEIAVRGPQVMAGYWGRPDETARVMTPDGFLRTGDIGTMDARGYFRVVDRKKDMIIVSGFNVYPNEVEEVVSAHPGVRECAVVGMPDAHSGEAVRLFVVRKDPELSAEALSAHCHARLTGYKCPRHIEFREDLPKTNVGKILRRELRQS